MPNRILKNRVIDEQNRKNGSMWMPCCLQEMEEEKKLEQRRIKDFSGWLQLIRDKRKVCETLNMMQKYQQIADTCIYHPVLYTWMHIKYWSGLFWFEII